MPNNQSSSQQEIDGNKLRYKNSCYGRRCDKTGINQLKIAYINKIGWFCDSCTRTLKKLELVEEIE